MIPNVVSRLFQKTINDLLVQLHSEGKLGSAGTATVTDTFEILPLQPSPLPTEYIPSIVHNVESGGKPDQVPYDIPEIPKVVRSDEPADIGSLLDSILIPPKLFSGIRPQSDDLSPNITSGMWPKYTVPPLMRIKNKPAFNIMGNQQSDILLFVPHGDEVSAKELASEYAEKGYNALISTSQSRSLAGVSEPNKVFGKKGNELRNEVEQQMFSASNKLVIALHNTRGGALASELMRSDSVRIKEPKYGGYILTNDKRIYDSLVANTPYNIILQSRTTSKNNDNSLSRYATLKGKPYVNVEAVRNDKAKQRAMLNSVLAIYGSI